MPRAVVLKNSDHHVVFIRKVGIRQQQEVMVTLFDICWSYGPMPEDNRLPTTYFVDQGIWIGRETTWKRVYSGDRRKGAEAWVNRAIQTLTARLP